MTMVMFGAGLLLMTNRVDEQVWCAPKLAPTAKKMPRPKQTQKPWTLYSCPSSGGVKKVQQAAKRDERPKKHQATEDSASTSSVFIVRPPDFKPMRMDNKERFGSPPPMEVECGAARGQQW